MDYNRRNVSIYKNYNKGLSDFNTKPYYRKSHTLNIEQIYEVIKQGGGVHDIEDIKDSINFIQSHTKEEYRFIKLDLPSFTVSSDFTDKKTKQADKVYTQIMGFDFDKLDSDTLNKAYQNLMGWEGTALLFKSPSGKGLKVFAYIDSTEKQHEQVYKCMMQLFINLFDLEADTQCVDYTRLCYFSYDPNAFYNPDAPIVPSKQVVEKYKHLIGINNSLEVDTINYDAVDTENIKSIFYSFIGQLKTKGVDWTDGKRNQFLIEVCKLKRFGVTFNECLTELLTYIDGRFTSEYTYTTIPDSLAYNWNRYFNNYGITKPEQVKRFTINNYLTEKKDFIKSELLRKRIIYIDAPTGAGKTTLVKQIAKELNLKTDILMPTTALVEQQDVLSLTGRKGLKGEHLESDILAVCYNSVNKIQVRNSKLLVVDEAHSLVSDYGYKNKTIQDIQRCLDNYDYTIYLSGSILPLEGHYTPDTLLSFEKVNRFSYKYELVPLGKSVSNKNYFNSTYESGKLNVFYKNDKTELDKLYLHLTKKGLKVAYITSDKKENLEYKGIVENSSLNGYDVLLTTCVIQSGVNINECDREVNITFGSGCNLIDYIQFTARFRNHAPHIRIIHSGKMGQIFLPDSEELKTRVTLEKQLLEKAREKNGTRDMDLFSLEADKIVKGLDYIYKDNSGQYVEDAYYLLYNKYSTLNRNISSNVRVLKAYLEQFNFTQTESKEFTVDGEEKEEQEQMGRNYNKEVKQKREDIIDSIFNHTHVFNQATDKTTKEIEKKYMWLSKYMKDVDIKEHNLLTSNTTYNLYKSRIVYTLAQSNLKEGKQVADKVSLEYSKFNLLKKQIQVNTTYTTKELKDMIVSSGFTPSSKIDDVLKVVYQVERSKDYSRYTITGKVDFTGLLKDNSSGITDSLI